MKLRLENQTIKEVGKLTMIGLSYVFGNMFYHISLGLNKVFRYLLKSIGFELKFVKYPKQKKDEDILGI
jgi:hypothetical protein